MPSVLWPASAVGRAAVYGVVGREPSVQVCAGGKHTGDLARRSRAIDTYAVCGETRLHRYSFTVKDHVKSIFDEVDVRSRRGLVAHVLAGNQCTSSPTWRLGRVRQLWPTTV
jgi:hypothetical protein